MAAEGARSLTPALVGALRVAHEALQEARVKHALAGGLAVNVWGRQRLTTDVDFAVVVRSLEALEALVRRLQLGRFLTLDARPLAFRRAWVGRLAHAPEGAKQPLLVDLIRPIGRGAEAWTMAMMKRVTSASIAGMEMPVVAPEDLVLFKLLVHEDRGYDLGDARSVLDLLGTGIDRRYLERHARALGVLAKLRAL